MLLSNRSGLLDCSSDSKVLLAHEPAVQSVLRVSTAGHMPECRPTRALVVTRRTNLDRLRLFLVAVVHRRACVLLLVSVLRCVRLASLLRALRAVSSSRRYGLSLDDDLFARTGVAETLLGVSELLLLGDCWLRLLAENLVASLAHFRLNWAPNSRLLAQLAQSLVRGTFSDVSPAVLIYVALTKM